MFEPLPGFRDFYPEECRRRDYLFRQWRQWARRYDFEAYDIPTLESRELLTRKSGEEIVSQLFHFEDQGGRAVALRPEITTSLARMIGARANSLKRPIKWYTIAENFRYERQQKGRLRSHYQFNADIFGEPGEQADAEIIALLLESLRGFGFSPNDIVLRLSDRVLWSLFLESLGIEGEAALEVLAIADKMERMPREALEEKLAPYFNEATEEFLATVEGLRSRRGIEQLESTLLALMPNPALRERVQARSAQWNELLQSLRALGVGDFIRIDPGIVRGLAYYTGFVFEVFPVDAEGEPTGRALAGGGRFDGLVERLGFPAMPAVGFGMGDVVLADCLSAKNLLPPLVEAPDFFCVLGGDEERCLALEDAGRLRRDGFRVRYPLKVAGFGKQFKQAGQSGARMALIYGSEEAASGTVRLRDLQSGDEAAVSRHQLLPIIHRYLEDPETLHHLNQDHEQK